MVDAQFGRAAALKMKAHVWQQEQGAEREAVYVACSF